MSSFTNPGYLVFSAPPSTEEQLRGRVRQLEQSIEALNKEPLGILTVVALAGPGRGIVAGGPPVEISVPEGTKVGSQLRCVPQTKNGFTLLPEPLAFGPVLEVLSVVPGGAVLKQGNIDRLVVAPDHLELEPGDRVVLDASDAVALHRLPRGTHAFELGAAKRVAWADIGGQDEAKEALREAIEYPVVHAKVYEAHGQKPAKGALLYGPPGTGKSMLARALATSIAGDTGGFIYVKATEVMSKWQGESGQSVRSLFQRGRDYQAKTSKRAVLFIDEADALLPVRDGQGIKISGGAEDMVPVFLAEMDGLDELGPFVLLATNRPDRIDPAVLRDGRCDTKVHVNRPDRTSCEAIFKLALRGRNVSEGFLNDMAKTGTELLWSERNTILELSYPGVRTQEYVRLTDLVSGAMIEGIVQRAAAIAIKRDRENGSLSRLGDDDLAEAVKLTLRQQANVNHEAVIAEKSKPYGRAPEKVRKVIDG